jgi:hypothetical protein
MNRPLTTAEKDLVQWMLEHGKPEAKTFLSQLEKAKVTPWRCKCGCASINFAVEGFPEPSGALHPIADFTFGDEENLSGIFIYEQSGVLAGLEVYGLAGDAPKLLPPIESLRPF